MKRLVILLVLLMLAIPISSAKEVAIKDLFEVDRPIKVTSGDKSSTSSTTYFYAGSKLLASKGEELTYHYQDRLGSDVESKSLPFGQEIIKGERFSFTGKELDQDLYYFGARYYYSNLGRFTSVDPVPSEPVYQYVGNNPINMVDPDGRLISFAAPEGKSMGNYEIGKNLLIKAAEEHGGNYQKIVNALDDLETRTDVNVLIVDVKLDYDSVPFIEVPGLEGPGEVLSEKDIEEVSHYYVDHLSSVNCIFGDDSCSPVAVLSQEESEFISENLEVNSKMFSISGASSLFHEIGHVLFEHGYFDEEFSDVESNLWAGGDGIYHFGPREGFNYYDSRNEVFPIYLENMLRHLEGVNFENFRKSHNDMGF